MQSINSNSLNSNLNETKANLIAELDKRVTDHILEQTNADLLKKLITNADSIPEAQAIAEFPIIINFFYMIFNNFSLTI